MPASLIDKHQPGSLRMMLSDHPSGLITQRLPFMNKVAGSVICYAFPFVFGNSDHFLSIDSILRVLLPGN
jgi:hypothetical protein